MIWGLWTLDFWAAFLGATLASACKVWFVDRMVWLYEDMKEIGADYSCWLY
jgi:hypothetical protein